MSGGSQGPVEAEKSAAPEAQNRKRRNDFVKALNHPVRVQILATVTNRAASPREMSRKLGEELGTVSYHSRTLQKLGYIEVVAERKVRGAREHFYRATERPWFPADEWEQLDPSVRSVASKWTLDRLVEDAVGSLNAGTFDKRGDRHLSRSPIALDEEGWRRVSAILDDTLDAILEESSVSSGRMAESGEQPVSAVIGMFSFEAAPGESGLAST